MRVPAPAAAGSPGRGPSRLLRPAGSCPTVSHALLAALALLVSVVVGCDDPTRPATPSTTPAHRGGPMRTSGTVVVNGIAMTDLGVPVAGGFATARGVNNAGIVVGSGGPYNATLATEQSHGWFWDPTAQTMTDLGVSTRDYGNGIWSVASAVNNQNQIAGFGRDNYWSSTESVMSATTAVPVWTTYAPEFEATGITDQMVIVGSTPDYIGDYHHAFAFTPSDNMLYDLPMLAGDAHAAAQAINGANHIVGWGWGTDGSCAHPVRWNSPTDAPTAVPLPASATCGGATAVNDSDVVAGRYVDPATNAERAFVYDPATGRATDLGTLGGATARAAGINRHGHVVGSSTTASGDRHAFYWDPKTGIMTDLGTWTGDATSDALAINDNDLVVGVSAGASGGAPPHAVEWAVSTANVAPTAIPNGPYSGVEGRPITFSAAGSADAAGGTLTYTWDFGDGSRPVVTTATQVTHTYDDNPTTGSQYTATLTTTDPSGTSTSATSPVTVSNVAPTATFSASAATLPEGGTVTLSLTGAYDPSTADMSAGLLYSFNCGAGYSVLSHTATATCTAADNGPLVVRGVVADKDGGVTNYSATLTVTNVPPSGQIDAPGTVVEGASFTLRILNWTDPSPADLAAGLRFSFDCGDGRGFVSTSTAATTCPTGDNGVRTVGARMVDKDGGVWQQSATVTVINAPPIVNLSVTPTSQTVGLSVAAAGSFTDPGLNDGPWTYRLDWKDGTVQTGTLATQASTVNASHAYKAAGTYAVALTVTDKDGGAATGTVSVTIAAGKPTTKGGKP